MMEEQRSRADSAPKPTLVERRGDCELLVTRTFDAPPSLVYRAWSQAELFQRWWVPQSASGVSLVSCEMDVRTGGTYRLEFAVGGPQTMAFHGKYLEVIPDERIVWTNDESDEEGAVTTVTFEGRGGQTLLTFHEVYPSKAALDEAMQGAAAGLPEQLEQLDALLARNSE
jgi:uncharacterized protein YndB with AHSA1/START domain